MPNSRDLANAIRFLSIDAVQKANSGHPGMPMGMADIATVLWREFLNHNPANPDWVNRDRFVLSNGHGSMLLYALLHLTGYDLTINDLQQFRQLNSKTPGHPENTLTKGVETTTGPLGQGLGNAVGMAFAEKILNQQFNRPGYNIVDHYTYAFAGDGCMMEGVSHEVGSLAGLHQLGKLIVFWDDNGISIDGATKGWFIDNTAARFESYHWHVIKNIDGHNPKQIKKAIAEARFVTNQPTLICCKTTIAFGSPHLHDTAKAHGAPLGEEEVAATRKELNWLHPPFVIPDAIYASWNALPKGQQAEKYWQQKFQAYQREYPALAAEFLRRMQEALPDNWQKHVRAHGYEVNTNPQNIATRKASQNCLNAYGPVLPELIGGSADLTESNLTAWSGSVDITPSHAGNYLHYGVREFGMSVIMNGFALHGGFIPYGGTFLVFADYCRNAIRLSALDHVRVIYVLTHDSIGLGEDGPTHQPVEHLTMLRATPNVSVWRPCDESETAVAWQHAIERTTGPTCLVLTRQKVSAQTRTEVQLQNIHKGGYILLDCPKLPQAIIIATGSEVELAMQAARELHNQNYQVRVIAMPSTDIFAQQSASYREQVLPKAVTARVAIEAGSSDFWYKYVGLNGKVIGVDRFGKSAPQKVLFEDFALTTQNIVVSVLELLS